MELSRRCRGPIQTVTQEKGNLRHRLFKIGVALKGVDAVLEIGSGLALLFVKPGAILNAVAFITQDALQEDPHDFVASHLMHVARHFAFGAKHFVTLYLLGHGAIKVFVVISLLRRILWAFPVAMALFVAFIVYQIYRYTLTHSLVLILLTVLDVVVLFLVWLEYRSLRREVHGRRDSPHGRTRRAGQT
jgi:uncharacterized membrane protein